MIGRGRSDRETEANRTAAEQGPVPSPVRRSVSSFRVGRTCCCRKRAFCVQDVLIDDSIPTPLFSHKPSLRSPFPIQRVNTHTHPPLFSLSLSLFRTHARNPIDPSALHRSHRPADHRGSPVHRPRPTGSIDRSIDPCTNKKTRTHAHTQPSSSPPSEPWREASSGWSASGAAGDAARPRSRPGSAPASDRPGSVSGSGTNHRRRRHRTPPPNRPSGGSEADRTGAQSIDTTTMRTRRMRTKKDGEERKGKERKGKERKGKERKRSATQ